MSMSLYIAYWLNSAAVVYLGILISCNFSYRVYWYVPTTGQRSSSEAAMHRPAPKTYCRETRGNDIAKPADMDHCPCLELRIQYPVSRSLEDKYAFLEFHLHAMSLLKPVGWHPIASLRHMVLVQRLLQLLLPVLVSLVTSPWLGKSKYYHDSCIDL